MPSLPMTYNPIMANKIIPKNLNPKEAHENAERFRESDQHLEALQAAEIAIVGYQQQGNYPKLSEVLQTRFLTYKHLFLLTNDMSYAILGKNDTQASLQIALKHHLENMLASCYFSIGEAAMITNDYKAAISKYQQAVEIQPDGAQRGDYRYHLGEALYRNGEKQTGKEALYQGLKEIQTNKQGQDSFATHIWESGCHMRLADLLRTDEPKKAREHLAKFKEIIDTDKRLIIRKRQLAELSKQF
jgi:tetratricopeptide (TPR) repeat protein